jgi:PPM family protein phosphatase
LKIDNYNLIVGNATDVGQVRQCNEDYMAHFTSTYGYCIIVCDGMGGHKAGDVASQSAIEAIKHYLQDGSLTKLETPYSLLNAIEFANYKLREMVVQNPGLSGMGTTCIMALINNNIMYVAHAGDSRLYLIRRNEIKQISKDHSTVQQLIDAGAITEEEGKQSDKRNQITKAIGIFEKVEPSITHDPVELRYNDKILLCTDGLTSHLNTKDILRIIKSFPDVQSAAMKLVEKANAEGGSDNITVQLIEYKGKSSSNNQHRRLRKRVLRLTLVSILLVSGFLSYKLIFPTLRKDRTSIINTSDSLKQSIYKNQTEGGSLNSEENRNKMDSNIINSRFKNPSYEKANISNKDSLK